VSHSFSAISDFFRDEGCRSFFFDAGIMRLIDEFDDDRGQNFDNFELDSGKFIINFLLLREMRLDNGSYPQLFNRRGQL